MKIKEITSAIEESAPLRLQESYDNSGLLVGDADAEVDSALLCVDITEAVLDEALRLGAGLIISHHPVIFHPLRHITGSTYIERVVAKAIVHDIALYACHTNLDSAPDGMSFRLGNLLGLRNVVLLGEPSSVDPGAGLGIVGELPEPTELHDFLRFVKKTLDCETIRYSGGGNPEVRKVAVCTGAGASMTNDARRAGADLFISSEFRYNDFLDAAGLMTIADVGHFESEYCAIDLVFDIITKKIPTFALHKSGESVNPVNYITV